MTTSPILEPDFRTYYDLESYLFGTVSPRFTSEHTLSAFDFFCIVIWKADRSKTKVVKRLLTHGKFPDLDSAVKSLSAKIAAALSPKDKLKVLVSDWGFLLPTASAILTVLYPDDFTVYDIRVCNVLGQFHSLKNRSNYESIWTGYTQFAAAVREKGPAELSLRDKDRWLWGKSFHEELREDIATNFSRTRKIPAEQQA